MQSRVCFNLLLSETNLEYALDCDLHNYPSCNLEYAPTCNLEYALDCDLHNYPSCNL